MSEMERRTSGNNADGERVVKVPRVGQLIHPVSQLQGRKGDTDEGDYFQVTSLRPLRELRSAAWAVFCSVREYPRYSLSH
jgi:hypothetical protein